VSMRLTAVTRPNNISRTSFDSDSSAFRHSGQNRLVGADLRLNALSHHGQIWSTCFGNSMIFAGVAPRNDSTMSDKSRDLANARAWAILRSSRFCSFLSSVARRRSIRELMIPLMISRGSEHMIEV